MLMRKKFLWFLIGINLIALPFIFFLKRAHFLYLNGHSSKAALPVYAEMPVFELTERSGKKITDHEMRGKPWIADFIYTECPNQCPTMSAKFSMLQKSLPSYMRLVSFSVDPARDTPEKLQHYAEHYHADKARWLFLTGEKTEIGRILLALHLGNGGDPNLHSLRFVLLDEKLSVRGYYNSEDSEALGQLKTDIQILEKSHE